MCGIAGRVNLFSDAPVDEQSVRAMCDLLAHRGPDAAGTLVRNQVGFGHRRLAIIDLSPDGAQPMQTVDGRLWITFNGEIYNYQELRRDLENRGRAFRSKSDTEVLLQCFAEYGVASLQRIRGMYAFAIWDARERKLFLVRDRVGKKPLFYRRDRDGIAFASESKAFFAEAAFEARPNLHALFDYLSLMYVPAPMSAFAGVEVLPPAHYLEADADGIRVCRYWKLRYDPKEPLDENAAAEAVVDKLREAIRLRLMSDVPLGAFLSGGIDSGLIVAMMAELGGQQGAVRTFSIGFEEDEFSELQKARQVAERYHTDHHEMIVRPEMTSVLPRLVWHYGEPFADPSAVPMFYLSELTRQHVTVALNGDGGDESFAGYDCYVPNRRNELYGRLPGLVRRTASDVAHTVGGNVSGARNRTQQWLAAMALDDEARYALAKQYFAPDVLRSLCTQEFADGAGERDPQKRLMEKFAESDAVSPLDRMLSVDAETYLPDDLLAKVDLATMAFGLEGRSPFLDHEFMELAAHLPHDFKLRGTSKKYLLRKIARRYLPDEVVRGPKKGFSVPIARWLRTDLRPLVSDFLVSGPLATRHLFRPGAVEGLVREHWNGQRDWHEQLWGILMLELWWQEFLDRRPSPSGTAARSHVMAPVPVGQA